MQLEDSKPFIEIGIALAMLLHQLSAESNMTSPSTDHLLPTLRVPHIRARSTEDIGYEARADQSETSSITRTLMNPEVREESEHWLRPRWFRAKLFRKLLFQWIGTVLLTASVVGLVYGFKAKGTLTAAQKSTYSFVSTALILLLGLSFYVRSSPPHTIC